MIVFTYSRIKPKKIGILGGMGPEATADLYKKIIQIFQEKYGAKYDEDFPEIFIYNLPLPDVVENPYQDKKIKEFLIRGVKKLESNGVDFIAIPCNTVNYYLPEMRNAVSIPVISILEETAKEVRTLNLSKVGLLATEMTINKNIYGSVLNDIKVVNPTKKQQKKITSIILNVLSGKKNKEDRLILKTIIEELKSNGAEKIILGCTELPLLIKKRKDTLDTLEILARAVVVQSINNAIKISLEAVKLLSQKKIMPKTI